MIKICKLKNKNKIRPMIITSSVLIVVKLPANFQVLEIQKSNRKLVLKMDMHLMVITNKLRIRVMPSLLKYEVVHGIDRLHRFSTIFYILKIGIIEMQFLQINLISFIYSFPLLLADDR